MSAVSEVTLPSCRLFLWDTGRAFRKHFASGFEAFYAAAGVDGLARITGNRLEILILISESGEALKRFVREAKAEFGEIAVWQFESHCHRDSFLGFDFIPYGERDPLTGEAREGLCWTRAHHLQMELFRERPIGARWKESTAAEIAAQRQATDAVLGKAALMRRAA